MLLQLAIQNYATVDSLEIEFGPGMSAISGETGAGKSILFDALGLLLGGEGGGGRGGERGGEGGGSGGEGSSVQR